MSYEKDVVLERALARMRETWKAVQVNCDRRQTQPSPDVPEGTYEARLLALTCGVR